MLGDLGEGVAQGTHVGDLLFELVDGLANGVGSGNRRGQGREGFAGLVNGGGGEGGAFFRGHKIRQKRPTCNRQEQGLR